MKHVAGIASPNEIHNYDSISTNGVQGPSHQSQNIYTPAPALASSRYNRQMLIPTVSLPGQEKIAAARILIIGLGGLGSPASLYLAGAGVGKLGLLDADMVEVSNLHRQVVHRESSVSAGMTKVQSALRGCRELNSDIELEPHELRLDVSSRDKAEEVLGIMEQYDIVLDCTDNPATRYLVSDLCVLLGKTLVSGAAQRLEGQIIVLNYPLPDSVDRGPCYRCVFPTPPSPEMVKGCGEIGILGPVVGTIGTLMATEALRLVVKGVEERKPSMVMYNAWPTDPRGMFRTFGLRGKRRDCKSCGDVSVLSEKGFGKISKDDISSGQMDYVAFCGLVAEIKLLNDDQRLSTSEFLRILNRSGGTEEKKPNSILYRNPAVVDVREAHEVEMGPKIAGSVNVPITKILRQDSAIEELSQLLHNHDAAIFICPQGNDSQIAAQKLLDARAQSKYGVVDVQDVFVGDVAGGFAALERVA